jgi:quercetin dioxygenase-like cupin family protein
MKTRTVSLLLAWATFIFGTSIVYAQSGESSDSPPLDQAQVYFDVAKPDLNVVVPGQVAFRHWQSTVSTAAMLRLTKGATGHAPTVAEQYGQIHMHLLEGKLRVIFDKQELLLKSGDVASWGNLRHRIQCEAKECLLSVISSPLAWQRLGPEDSGPVPLYMDPDYLRKVGAHGGAEK